MGCIRDIRETLFPGSDSGGDLTYDGYSDVVGGPYGAGGSPIPPIAGDTLLLDTEDMIVGFYKFTYEDESNDCDIPQTAILQITPQVVEGVILEPVSCVNDTGLWILRFILFGETEGGVWSVNPQSDPMDPSWYNLSPGNETFNITNCDTPGTYLFDYTVGIDEAETGFDIDNCPSCTIVQTISIVMIPASNAGDDATVPIPETNGTFNLIDYLLGVPDYGGSWTQLSGTPVTISNGDLGTVNLDSIPDCELQFEYSVGDGNCEDTAVLTIIRANDLELYITQVGSTLVANHEACSSPTYLWERWTGLAWVDTGLTTQTITPPSNDLYRCILTCGDCTDIAQIEYLNCDHDFDFSLSYNAESECLEITPTGSATLATVDTDILEWRRVGDPTWTQFASAPYSPPETICGCDIREFLQVVGSCLDVGSSICATVGDFDTCDGNDQQVDQITWQFGSGASNSQENTSGGSQCAGQGIWNIWSNLLLAIVSHTTDAGTLRANVAFFYDGAGSQCSDLTIDQSENYAELFYQIEVRRTITFNGNCDDVVITKTWQGCNIEAWITEDNGTLTANYTGASCGTPSFRWQTWNGSSWVNASSNSTYTVSATGIYRVEITCNGCSVFAYHLYTAPCEIGIEITESEGVLTANVSGCGTISNEYWTLTNAQGQVIFLNYGNTTTLNESGTYTYNVFCENCSASAQYIYNAPCNGAVTIQQNGSQLEAVVTGCGSDPVSYLWEYSPDGNAPWTTFGNTQTITPDQTGFYRVTINCSSCSDSDVYEFCDINVQIENNEGTLVAQILGSCASSPSYQWQRWTGVAWVNVGFDSPSYTPSINGLYRVIVTCGGCSDSDEYDYDSLCDQVEVSIALVDGEFISTVEGCGANPISYSWEYFDNGSWVQVATTPNYTPAESGLYRLSISCGDCVDSDTITYDSGCDYFVTINESNGTLTANTSGCAGSESFIWEVSFDGGQNWSQVGTGSTYDPTQNALYRVTATCDDGCEDQDIYEFNASCTNTVSLAIINSGTQLEATVAFCSDPTIDYIWQYSETGTGWSAATGATNSNILTPQDGTGFYRVIAYCGGTPLCPSQDTIQWSDPCNGSVSISNNPSNCLYEISLENPDDGSNTARLQVSNNSTNTEAVVRKLVDECGSEIVNQLEIETSDCARFITTPSNGNLGAGGFFKTLEVHDHLSGTSTALDVNPSTTSYLTCSGGCCGGTVSASDLYFDSANPGVMQAAFRQLLVNALCEEFSAEDGVDYELTVQIFSNGGFTIRFVNKHNPVGQWIGFENTDDLTYERTPGNTLGSSATGFQHSIFFWNEVYSTPCGNINVRKKVTGLMIDSSNSQYDTIIFNSPTWPLEDDGIDNPTITCTENTITSSVSGCSGNVLYTWNYREDPGDPWTVLPETGPTLITQLSGEIQLIVNCGTCTYSSNIISI